MSAAPTLEQVRFDLVRLQSQVTALEQSMSNLAHDMMALDLQIMAIGQRVWAIEEARSQNADTSDAPVRETRMHDADSVRPILPDAPASDQAH